jgi:hypothetical protein
VPGQGVSTIRANRNRKRNCDCKIGSRRRPVSDQIPFYSVCMGRLRQILTGAGLRSGQKNGAHTLTCRCPASFGSGQRRLEQFLEESSQGLIAGSQVWNAHTYLPRAIVGSSCHLTSVQKSLLLPASFASFRTSSRRSAISCPPFRTRRGAENGVGTWGVQLTHQWLAFSSCPVQSILRNAFKARS